MSSSDEDFDISDDEEMRDPGAMRSLFLKLPLLSTARQAQRGRGQLGRRVASEPSPLIAPETHERAREPER
eukprot:COSAG02_NODE_6999_length_3235_cov_90.955038_1_plen_71_part_00